MCGVYTTEGCHSFVIWVLCVVYTISMARAEAVKAPTIEQLEEVARREGLTLSQTELKAYLGEEKYSHICTDKYMCRLLHLE